ncbi:hypothetical protein N7481_002179 [Penicillium waksmanii]|uniref:uncharacterized protein n=1 Tax=Penicillium waksmanii TaxID=69791 RepID=UPI002547D0E1|nr:uncharacterized protein N7481_002179 [Penicillium waksmanii]KAJ5995202.1 hypothetical protein N7481_002179 [Penicillium waksmanii]
MFQLVIASSAARERLAAEYIGREYRVHGHDALALHACVRWTAWPVMLIRSSPPLGLCGVSFCWPWIAHGGQWPIVKSCAHEKFPGRSEEIGILRAMMFKVQRLVKLFSGRDCGENPLAPTTDAVPVI